MVLVIYALLPFSKLRQVIAWVAEPVLLEALRFLLLRTRPGQRFGWVKQSETADTCRHDQIVHASVQLQTHTNTMTLC